MAAQGSVKDWFTFVGGLNTEGGYFNTPERNWVSGDNILPKTDGSVERRNGIDLEEGHVFTSGTLDTEGSDVLDAIVTVGYWEDRVVVQHGYLLEIYENVAGTISSTHLPALTVDLRVYNPNTDAPSIYPVTGTKPCSYAVAYGKLIVTNGETNPIVLSFEPGLGPLAEDVYTVKEITIQIRDFKGIDTQKPIDTELTDAEWIAYSETWSPPSTDGGNIAMYNLHNQGWTSTQINTYKTAFFDNLPSNTKSWIWGKDASDDFQATLLNKQDFGTSPAPKGRFVLNLFYQNRGYDGSTFEEETIYRSRFTTTAFYAGRTWYAGAAEDDLKGNVYFSQVLSNFDKIGNCYQQNDPTSEIISDLLDSDGGIVSVPDAGNVLAIAPLGRGLLVLGENGVYAISGIDGVFSAANYQVEKISEVGCIAAKSVVVVENSLLYWSQQGIYGVSQDQSGYSYSAQNISDAGIRTLYNDIPYSNKLLVQGAYNSSTKEIYWLYKKELDSTSVHVKTGILALNTALQAWNTHSIPTTDQNATYIASLFTTTENNFVTVTSDVVANNGDTVVTSSSDIVTAESVNAAVGKKQFKFVTNTFPETGSTKSSASPSNGDLITTWAGRGESFILGPQKTRYISPTHTILYALIYPNSGGYLSRRRLYRVVFTKATEESTEVTATATYIEAGVDNTLHAGADFSMTAFDFNLDGTRLYTSEVELVFSDPRSRFGYYPLSTPYSLSSAGSYVVLDTLASTDALYEDILFSCIRITDRGTFTARSGEEVLWLSHWNTPSDGNPTTIIVPRDEKIINTNNTNEKMFNQFEFDPSGMGIYTGYRRSTVQHSHNFFTGISGSYITLPAPYDLTGLTEAHILATNNNDFYDGYRSYLATGLGVIPTFATDGSIAGLFEVDFDAVLFSNSVDIKTDVYWPNVGFKKSSIGFTNSNVLNRTIEFADFNNLRNADTKFKDWYSVDNTGIDTEAFLVTGYQFADVGPARNKTGMYLTTYSKRTETGLDDVGVPINPSSIKMQLRWDFTDDYGAGKWAVPVEVYRQPRAYLGTPGDITFEDGYPLVISKSKMRGRGKAVQFKFSSSDGYDMKLFGWTGTFVGNTNV